MARQNRGNSFLVLLIFLILVAAVVVFLLLVWEVPSPAQTNVQCRVPEEVFSGQDVPDDLLCEP